MSDQYRDSVRKMDRKIYEQLVNSLATGRWPDGRTLTADQRAHAMQAVIAWGEMHLPPEERIGFIDKGATAGEVCDEPTTLTWKDSQDD